MIRTIILYGMYSNVCNDPGGVDPDPDVYDPDPGVDPRLVLLTFCLTEDLLYLLFALLKMPYF